MNDWRNFNNVSFESIMVILYDKGMTTVIHPGTLSQHSFVSGGLFFSGTHCISPTDQRRLVLVILRDR